jgi:hypothetical protein
VCANCFFSSFLSFLADFNHIPEVFFFYLFFAETSYCAPESFFFVFRVDVVDVLRKEGSCFYFIFLSHQR